MNICVYGSASDKINKCYIKAVEDLGVEIAKRGMNLVFGAGGNGLMGAAARGVMAGGGHITGIIPEFFRDENLQDSVEVPTGDGPDTEDIYPLLKRGKRQDYFTSCLPQPQKGPGVELPLGTTAPVTADLSTPGATYLSLFKTDNSSNTPIYRS